MEARFFLKIDLIPGESTNPRHVDEIEVQAWDWGESSAPNIGRGTAAGKVQIRPLHITAHSSSASPLLFLACAKGQVVHNAVLTATRQIARQDQDYMIWRLSEVIVTSFQTSVDKDGTTLLDEFNLGFARIKIEYRPIKPDGSLGNPISAEWDLKANRPV